MKAYLGMKADLEYTSRRYQEYTTLSSSAGDDVCDLGCEPELSTDPEPELTTLTGTFPVDERPTPVQQEPTGGSDETNPLTEAENDDFGKNASMGLLRHDNCSDIVVANRAPE